MSVRRGNVSISGPINVHLTRGCLPPSDVDGDRGWHLLRHLLPISGGRGTRGPGPVVRASHVTPLLLSPEQGRERERADRGMLGIGGAHNTLTSDTRGGGLKPVCDVRSDCVTTNTAHLFSSLMQLVITGECFYPPTALLETAARVTWLRHKEWGQDR